MKLEMYDTVFITDIANHGSCMDTGQRKVAEARLEGMGLKMRYASDTTKDPNRMPYAPDKIRAANFNEGILDPNVRMILAFVGGSSSQWYLDQVDLDELIASGKLFAGYSDCASVCNRLAKMGAVSVYGPSFTNFCDPYFDYTLGNWRALVMNGSLKVTCPEFFIEEPKSSQNMNRPYETKFPAWEVIQGNGTVSGPALVGNLATFTRLYDEYRPDVTGSIVIAESMALETNDFISALDSVLHRGKPKAICVGTFGRSMVPNHDDLISGILRIPSLDPSTIVITGFPTGHVAPRTSIGIGGRCTLTAGRDGSIDFETTLEPAMPTT